MSGNGELANLEQPTKGLAMSDIMGYRREDGQEVDENYLESMHDDMLNEVYEPFTMGYLEFAPSSILENLDPIAYRQSVLEYWDALCEDGEYVETYEETDVYEDEEEVTPEDEDYLTDTDDQ